LTSPASSPTKTTPQSRKGVQQDPNTAGAKEPSYSKDIQRTKYREMPKERIVQERRPKKPRTAKISKERILQESPKKEPRTAKIPKERIALQRSPKENNRTAKIPKEQSYSKEVPKKKYCKELRPTHP